MVSHDDDSDGPSDESPSESEGSESLSYYSEDPSYRDGGEDRRHRIASMARTPIPPPPATRPPPRGGGMAGSSIGSYPTTVEVKGVGHSPRSRIADLRRKARRREDEKDEDDDHIDDDEDDDDTGGGVVPRSGGSGGGGRGGAYVSFGYAGDGSVDYSLDEMASRRHAGPQDRSSSSADHHSLPLDEARGAPRSRLPRLPPPPQNMHPRSQQQHHRARKPQVLVHYHPQLGDTGYESTLLDETPPSPSIARPHKHAIVTNWMHARSIDDVREEKELGGAVGQSSMVHHRGGAAAGGVGGPPRSPRFPPAAGGNDEYNNAATRQIRRRVLRAAMERSAREWSAPQDDRRRKMSEADADIGGAPIHGRGGMAFGYPGASAVDRSSSVVDAFRSPGSVDSMGASRSTTPGGITTARGAFANDDRGVGGSPVDVPPPPPSYKTLVADLIASNEPEKLSQVDRVMEKYAGREEELIKKLDLRYRRQRMKSAMKQQSQPSKPSDNDRVEMEYMSSPPQPPPPPPQPASSVTKTVDNGDDEFKPVAVIRTQILTPPKKLTFIRVDKHPNKNRGVISPMHSWDKSEGAGEQDSDLHDATEGRGKNGNDHDRDEFAMPPKITEKKLLKAISDSTKTLVHANMMEDIDENSGMIPHNPKVNVNSTELGNPAENEPMKPEVGLSSHYAADVCAGDEGNYEVGDVGGHDDNDPDEIMMPPQITKKILPRAISDSTQKTATHANVDPFTSSANFDSMNLENHMKNECLELEDTRRQLAEKCLQLEEKMLVNGIFGQGNVVEVSQSDLAPQSESAMSPKSSQRKVETFSGNSPNLSHDYKIRRATSNISKAYDDGISVITMETKITLPNRATHPVGDGDAVYSFDQMLKRPPNSITVESSGSGSDGINVEKLQTSLMSKLHRVAPEIETEEEKSRLAEASLIAAAKLDNVEARIRARYKLMEEEAAKKNENLVKPQDAVVMDTLLEAHDELSDMESMFREAKSKASLQVDYSELDEGKEKEQVDKGADIDTVEVEKENEAVEEAATNGMNWSSIVAVRHESKQTDSGMDSKDAADQRIIESILSSFDEEDQTLCVDGGKVHQRTQKEVIDLQTITSLHAVDDKGVRQLPMNLSSPNDRGGDSIVSAMSHHSTSMMAIIMATQTELKRLREVAAFNQERSEDAAVSSSPAITNDNLEEEVTRLIAEKESRLQAEQAVALLKAQKELEAERRARLEAETARVMAEIELQRLKSGKYLKKKEELAGQGCDGGTDQKQADDVAATAPLEPEEETSSDSPGQSLSHTQLDLEKGQSEILISSLEDLRVKTNEELEIEKIDEMVKEDPVVEESHIVTNALMQQERKLPYVIDQFRLEAEVTRLQAEKELELLRAERAAALALDYDEMVQEVDGLPDTIENKSALQRSDSGHSVNEVEEYRQMYSSDDEHVSGYDETVIAEVPQHISEDENRGKFNVVLERVVRKSSSDESEGVELATQINTSQTSDVEICDHDVAERTVPQRKDSFEEVEAHVAMTSEKKTDEALGNELSSEASGLESNSAEKYTHHVIAQENGPDDKVVETNERDIPLKRSKPALPKNTDEEVEAEIHHVAVVTFEGNPMKGQLSFITGTKIEAHSNQRGPWWLGRCGTRTGWFPARAVVPESEYLARFNSPSPAVFDFDESEMVDHLSDDELNAVYDLIRNPSDDPLEQEQDVNDSDDDSESPARSRWLNAGAVKSNATSSSSRNRSPPPTRSDPSEMAGLSERLYESNDGDSHSESNERISPFAVTTKPDVMSTNDANDAIENLTIPPSDGAAKVSQPDANIPKRKPKGEWRAAKDPNSGLTYYYHSVTKETTWYKPPGFVSRKVVANGSSPKTSTTERSSKGRRGRGIMNFLTNIAKPASPTKASGKPNLDSSAEAKNEETTHVRTSTKAEKLTVDVGKIEQKNSWLTLDDKVSVSDDSSDSEDTFTSIFSKRKIKSVRKWAGKITERLNSPPSQPYKTLNDGTKEPQDSALSSAKNQPTESKHVASNDGPSPKKELDQPIQSEGSDVSYHEFPIPTKNELEQPIQSEVSDVSNHKGPMPTKNELKQPIQSEVSDVSNHEGPIPTKNELEQPIQSEVSDVSNHEGRMPTKNEPTGQVTQDATDAKDVSILNSPETYVPQVQVNPPDVVDSKKPSRKQPQWRSAIDPHTGRTYFFIRGTSKVTWEKPSEMSD